MSILLILGIVLLVGVVTWAINATIPMASPIGALFNALVAILLICWLLQQFGIANWFPHMRIR